MKMQKPSVTLVFQPTLLNLMRISTSLAESKKDQIAVVVARGQIVNGTQRAGMIGGDSTCCPIA